MTCPELEEFELYLSDDLPAAQRRTVALHLESCADCRALLRDVEENSHTLAALKSARPGAALRDDAPLPRIPGYEIVGALHAGGQGVVYEAMQASTRRPVAVKLLLHGRYADRRARRRFEREIDLVASLDHPGIVTVFDSGTTDDGRMFLVMRLVDGRPLDPAETARCLDVQAALALFRKIAAAVTFAHQHGVIHRDLKPSNVLIDADGEPHLLDFGLAKAAHVPDAQQSLQTQAGEFVGTLAYAAPEQVRGDPAAVDVRSDVYALGVMLFEMLTGTHPYPVDGHLASIVRNITELDALRPSSRRREVDDELDTIVLKALSKDKERRYQSVADLLKDLERYAAGLPIEAKGDSTWYLLRKSLRRHRVPVAAAMLVFLALISATAVSVGFWRAAEADRDRAQAAYEASDLEAKKAQAINDFLLDILASANPARLGRDVTVREALASAAATIDASFADAPLVEANVRHTLAVTFRALGLYPDAEPHIRRAFELRRTLLGELDQDTLTSMALLGLLLSDMGRFPEAEQLCARTYELQQRISGTDGRPALTALSNLGLLRYRQGRVHEAQQTWERVLDRRLAVLGEEHEETVLSMTNLGWVCCNLGQFDRASELITAALAIRRRMLGAEHPETLRALTNAGHLSNTMGRYAEAAAYLEEALPAQQRHLGDAHPDTLYTLDTLAWAYLQLGRFDDAETLQLACVSHAEQSLGADHPSTLRMMNNLAINYDRQDRLDEAEPLYRRTLELRTASLGSDHLDTLASLNNLAVVYYKQQRFDETEKLWDEVLMARSRTLGRDHPETFVAMNNLALLYTRLRRFEEAERLYQRVLEGRRRVFGPDSPVTLSSLHNLAWLRRDQGRLDEAIQIAEDVLAKRREVLGAMHPDTFKTLFNLVDALEQAQQYDRAESLLVESIAAVEQELGENHERARTAHERLALLRSSRDAARVDPAAEPES